jgi:hypothetical protein
LPRVDEGERTVNPDSNGYFELFFLRVNDETVRRQVIFRDDNGTEQRFDVDDQVELAMHAFYTLTIRASCAQGHPTEARFESRFASPVRGNEAFQLQPIV